MQTRTIEQKGMTFDHDFCYLFSFSSSLFYKEGEERGKRITKVVVKSHAFLLDQLELGPLQKKGHSNEKQYFCPFESV